MNYSMPNGSNWLDLIGWANGVTDGFFLPGFILLICAVILVRTYRNSQDFPESFLTAVVITFVLTLMGAAMSLVGVPLIGAKWIAFEVALLVLALIFYFVS